MWTCQARELKPMSFGVGTGKAKATPALPPGEAGGDNDGESGGAQEGLFYRMLGRGRSRTVDSGDYEMTGVENRDISV